MIFKIGSHLFFNIYGIQISFAKYPLIYQSREVNKVKNSSNLAYEETQEDEMIFQSHRTNKHELGKKSSLPIPTPKLLMLFFIILLI